MNQGISPTIGISNTFVFERDLAAPPGRALILLESSITDAILMESLDYILQQ